jgi:hypothetical protein
MKASALLVMVSPLLSTTWLRAKITRLSQFGDSDEAAGAADGTRG